MNVLQKAQKGREKQDEKRKRMMKKRLEKEDGEQRDFFYKR